MCSGELEEPGSGTNNAESSLGWDEASLSEDDDEVPALSVPPGNIAGSNGLKVPLKLLFMFTKIFFLNRMIM